MSIELAPHNKQGLSLTSPLIAGSGATGFADAWPPQITPRLFGAVVLSPISREPRQGPAQPRLVEVPGGFLLSTGDHNPGYRRVLRDHGQDWQRLGVPVLAALAVSSPEVWSDLAGKLEEDAAVAGIELPLPEDSTSSEAAALVSAVRRSTTLPLLTRLPMTRAAELAHACARAGSDALVVGIPPYAAYPAAGGTLVEGPIGGPAALPFMLHALRAVAMLRLELPLIAAGGIQNREQVKLCMELGAVAVQIRSLLWTDPAAASRLAESLRDETAVL